MTGGPASPPQPAEQRRYAAVLAWGTRTGLVVLMLTFVPYISGIVRAHVPPEKLPGIWHNPVDVYLELTQSPTGWSWLGMSHNVDIACLLGVAILASWSVPCLLSLVPIYAKRGDRAFLAICLAEIAVIALAASGLMTGAR